MEKVAMDSFQAARYDEGITQKAGMGSIVQIVDLVGF